MGIFGKRREEPSEQKSEPEIKMTESDVETLLQESLEEKTKEQLNTLAMKLSQATVIARKNQDSDLFLKIQGRMEEIEEKAQTLVDEENRK